MTKKATRKFKSGVLHEKHVIETWNVENYLRIRLWTQEKQEDTR